MNTKLRGLNLFSSAKKSIALCFIIFPAIIFAQVDRQQAAKNLKGQEMESKRGNYTSFTVQHQDLSAWAKFNKKSKHPEFGRLPFNAAYPGYVEVLEKRGVDERYLVNEKNPTEFVVQKGLGALHYKVNGEWLTIDHRLEDKGNGIYEAEKQYDLVGFDVKKSTSYIKTPDGTVDFNNWKLYGSDVNGAEQLLAWANWSNHTAGEDGIYVTDIFPGIDAQMTVHRGSIKTDFIVKKLNYPTYTNLLFKDEFKTNIPSELKFLGYAANSKRAASGVSLYSGKTPLLEIGEAIAYPQNGSKDQRISAEYLLEGNNTLVTSVSVAWINKYINKTNVIIDPLVTSSNTLAQALILGSMYNNLVGCTFSGGASCNYNLVVNTPANATLTDVQWSFTYIAQGLCYLEDGGCRFTTGACVSPSQAGFYWFCNAANPGTCTGTNISIFSDLSPCLPAPSCAPTPVTFTMQFFRDCWGAAGCSNACIGANSPWTMTLTGHTVEFTNTATPFTVSANTICFGQTISASTSTQYGVPAHTVNWSFNSSGIPSVGSGNNPTISFPSAGTYTLYCIVTDGCAQTTTANQVITVNPIPTLTVTAASNPICQGQSDLLTASGATTYVWSANAGGGSGTTANVTPPVGTTVYTVTGTAAGCSNTGTVSVTVNPTPVITVTASPGTICAGQTATLTAGGATNYTWSPNAGGGTANPTTVTPGVSDTYTVTGDALGCTSTQTVAVTVTAPPTLTLTPSAATICAGAVATCTVTGATTYTWMPGNINADNISVNPANTTTYVVTGDNAGCVSTGTFVVTVTPLPSLTVTATPASICTGQTTTLTASGATTYTWSANSAGGNGNPISVSPGSTATYTLLGTQNGCSDSTTITVTVGSQPVVTVSASDTTICAAQSTTLTASGAANYTWSPGGNTNPITVSPGGTTTYTLIGDNGGCSDTTTFIVTVNPTPTITAVASPTAICSSQSSTLTASGAITYTWSANAGGGSANPTTVTPGTTDTFTVNGTDNNGCSGSAQVTVSVTATPVVIAIANPTVVCSGSQVGLAANGTATSYSWSTGATTQVTTDVPTNNPTTYTVTGFNGSCSSFTTVTVAVVTQPTVTVAGAPMALCAGQSSTLTATFNPPGSTINWSGGLGSNDTVVVTPGATSTYTITATNGTCTDAQSVTITVNPIPTLAAVSSQTVCSGNNVTSILFNASAGATVGWTNSNTAIGLAASGSGNIPGYLSPVVASQQTGTITATPVDNSTGCTGSSQMFTITINPKPVATTGTADSALCGMPTGDITGINVSNGTPGYTYQWYHGSTPVSGSAGTSINLNNQPIGTYSLVITDANSCMATSGPYTIAGTPAVIASFTANPTSGTAPLNVTFSNNSTGAVSYNWNLGNGSTPTIQNPNTIYTSGGNYTVILIAHNGSCQSMDTLTIHVDQAISLIVPNIFSPNGDGLNDDFSFVSSGISSLNCDIFNRWGQKIKTLSGPTDKWDGKLDNGNMASEGTYFYVVVASSYDGKPHNSQGSLTIVK